MATAYTAWWKPLCGRETSVDAETIAQKKAAIIDQYGDWTAHNICLGEDLYTIGQRIVGDEIKLRRIVQMVTDLSPRPLETMRVLDLACLEGLYGIELARRGAQVVGIEGRAANIEKARFAKEVLSLSNLELFQDDVRNLSRETYGEFDVVLCLGILYHLDAPDVFQFLERIAEVCRGFAIFHTHISETASTVQDYKGVQYWGSLYQEHEAESSQEERLKNLWASLDNPASFWPTRSSLYNALTQAGFTSVFECHIPPEPQIARDRITLVALKGQPQTLFSAPLLLQQPNELVPEAAPEVPVPVPAPAIAAPPEPPSALQKLKHRIKMLLQN